MPYFVAALAALVVALFRLWARRGRFCRRFTIPVFASQIRADNDRSAGTKKKGN